MIWIVAGVVIAMSLFLSAFFSGAETGLYRINRLRLHLGVQQRNPQAIRLSRVLEDEQDALSVALIGTNVMNYITTSTVAYLFAELMGFGETDTELYTVVIVAPIVFVFGEVVPKNLFQFHADRLLARGSRLLAVSSQVCHMTGAVWVLKRLAAAINHLTTGYAQSDGVFNPKRRVAMLLQEALAGDTLGEDQSDLIDRVCRLSETPLHSVMVPRNRVTVITAKADRRELMRIARRTGHTRLPVYEASGRRIIGVVKVDRLLQEDNWKTVGERLNPAPTVRPHGTVAAAITHLQRAGRAMAIVTDRGGQMLGVVTLKDLLSQVVGEVAVGD